MNELRFEKEFTIPGGKKSTAACVIPAYCGMPVHREAVVLGPKEVELELQRRCFRYATYETDSDSAGLGDMVNIDFQGSLNGEPFDDGLIEGFDLRLGSGTFVPGFERQIMGHSAGETFTITVNFPEDYPAEELKGQEASFTITVNEVKTLVVPEASDEIARKEGYEDLADMTEAIRRHRVALHRAKQDNELEAELLERLFNTTQVEIPQTLMDFTIRQLERKMFAGKVTRKQFLQRNRMSEEELSQQLHQRAASAVTKQLVVDGITQQEQLEPTAQEVEAELENFAKNAQGKRVQRTAQMKALMRERICFRNVGAFLLDHAAEEAEEG